MSANSRCWKLTARELRMIFYLVALIAFAVWKFAPRPWHPSFQLEAARHIIYSTATQEQTDHTLHALELLYNAYTNRFGGLPQFQRSHPKLQVKLFRERAEFHRINPSLSWGEAFYRRPFCRAYFSATENNPYHWMLHESVHQLNEEVAHLKLEKWLDEGLATYFAASRVSPTNLAVGRIDLDAYPVWWIDEIATSADLEENLRNGSVIPLRAILTNSGGPSLNSHFNLYYLHWWTLTDFLFENEHYRERALALIEAGGGLAEFEKIIGPVELVQIEWHAYARRLKAVLSGRDVKYFKTGKVLESHLMPSKP